MASQRIVGHLDMDAFFAAIEERDTPRFRGLPLVVGADPQGGTGRGVVSTANYPARKYGIHSAMPITKAWRLSQAAVARGDPEVLFLPGSYRHYGEVSRRIMVLLRAAVPIVQQRSVDEAYFDLSHTGSMGQAAALCRNIKEIIQQQEHLTASIGIGPNKMIAKIAANMQKPDGFTVVPEHEVRDFLEPLPIRSIPGVGPKTEVFLLARGIPTVREARKVSPDVWQSLLGKWGLELHEKVWGRDTAELIEDGPAKSIGEQETFPEDTLSAAFLIERLQALCEGVFQRLPEEGFQGFRTVVLTVRFADFRTLSCRSTARERLYTFQDLQHRALGLFFPFLDARKNPLHQDIRLLGIRLERLS